MCTWSHVDCNCCCVVSKCIWRNTTDTCRILFPPLINAFKAGSLTRWLAKCCSCPWLPQAFRAIQFVPSCQEFFAIKFLKTMLLFVAEGRLQQSDAEWIQQGHQVSILCFFLFGKLRTCPRGWNHCGTRTAGFSLTYHVVSNCHFKSTRIDSRPEIRHSDPGYPLFTSIRINPDGVFPFSLQFIELNVKPTLRAPPSSRLRILELFILNIHTFIILLNKAPPVHTNRLGNFIKGTHV